MDVIFLYWQSSINVDTLSFQTLPFLANPYHWAFNSIIFKLWLKQSELCSYSRKLEEDFSKELDLQIKGAEMPSVWELVGVRFVLLPYTIGKVVPMLSFKNISNSDCVLFKHNDDGYIFLLIYFSGGVSAISIWLDADLSLRVMEHEYWWLLFYYYPIQLLLWSGCWFWRYKVKKAPYSWEDASYLTQRSLGASLDAWRTVGKLNLIHLAL